MNLQKNLQDNLLHCSLLVQKKIIELLTTNKKTSNLIEAMRYSALSGGKRIRPFLVMACANLFDISDLKALNAAVAVELLHTYSLIHDDLPAMDNDDFRRNQPTCHKKFDEATAILAGDALLTLSFELLSDVQTHKDAAIRCDLIITLAKASGMNGMVGGQMIDLEVTSKKLTNEELVNLHRLKTGELFMASAEFGAILGYANTQQRNALRYYAHDLGLAFQIKDDILDYFGIENSKITIDEHHQNKSKDNASVVDIVGIRQANQQLEMLKDQAITHLKIFDNQRIKPLVELVEFVVSRKA